MAKDRWRLVLAAAAIAALLLVGALTYGFCLQLPFFSDDLVQYRWLEWHDLASIWRNAKGIRYFRPLPFTLWKILALLQGRYDAATSHAVNLALHLLNSVLVFGLAAVQRPGRSLPFRFSAALLFLLYPFSYQAVPWVGALTHPLVTALILGALLAHYASWRLHSRTLWVASASLALAAPFAHETGGLIAPLLLLLLLTDEQPRPFRKALAQTVPYWAVAVFGIAVSLAIPKDAPEGRLFDLQACWQNTAYFAQGLAYPVAPLAVRLAEAAKGLDLHWAVLLVSGGTALAWSLLLWKVGRGRLVVLSLGWFVLAAGPAWARLQPGYVEQGPRLLYEASVGVAFFWSIPVGIDWRGHRHAIAGTALAALVVIAAAASGYRFIRSRVPLHEQMRLAVSQLVDAQPEASGDPTLCINFPIWFGDWRTVYPLGREGVILAYSGVNDVLWLHTGQERPAKSVVLMDLLPQGRWRYAFACLGPAADGDSIQDEIRQVKRVVVMHYGQESIAAYGAGGLEAVDQPPAQTYLASFGRQIALLSASWQWQGSVLRIEARWQCRDKVAQETNVFLHLYDGTGKLVGQADGYPLMGVARLLSWQPGDEWRDVRLLPLPEGLAPGSYTVKVGLYPVQGGARLAATSVAGERYEDDAVPVGSLALPR